MVSVGLLLFGSGACALIYQTVWLRQFRLVFGSSTAATAAVLAIFLGGLGAGGLLLGRYADRFPRPLLLYGGLELTIAVWSALTPLLLLGVEKLYFSLGGSLNLGMVTATLVRLVLAALVLAPATLLMGGTLPAATGAVETSGDTRRTRFAVVYGLNTLGAVAGTLLSTFLLLETFGNRYTLWLACLANALIALIAIMIGRPRPAAVVSQPDEVVEESSRAPVLFVCIAAGIVGFVFMMLELIWYRVLAPLLGGSTFTFGLILAVALLGIGVGSGLYLVGKRDRASSVRIFALTCAVEALLAIVPFAIGDPIAIVAALLRSLRSIGFEGLVASWAAITLFVVFPAALLSGIQFPVLVSLLGRGKRDVGEHVGLAYASNTAGSFIGSVATGFGLFPLLTVLGAWRAAVVMLAVLAVVAAILAATRREPMGATAAAVLIAIIAATLAATPGPSPMWRHSPIGAGRVDMARWGKNEVRDFVHFRRRSISWEADGLESSVALSSEDGHALMVNGKSDGHARIDAGTQVMSGMLGAMLHPRPRRLLVVGLGTGSTGGWLAKLPDLDRVDIVEIEPAIVDAVPHFAAVNQSVHRNPKAHIIIGDAREVLLSEGDQYDVIASEPSNPYRAGVASLFTSDFYRNVRRRLAPGGLFLQWMQAYEIDLDTLRTVYASYLDVFPNVTTWQTQRGDLILIGSNGEIPFDVERMKKILEIEPYKSALQKTWRVDDVEGILAHYICGTPTAKLLARGARLNTDDKTVIEFGFARTVGESDRFSLADLKIAVATRAEREPVVLKGVVDPWLVAARRQSMVTAVAESPLYEPVMAPEMRMRLDAHRFYADGRYRDVLLAWERQQRGPSDSAEVLTFAEALADVGSEQALPFIHLLRFDHPIEADVLTARLRYRQQKFEEAADLLEKAFIAYRTDPWPLTVVMRRALTMALDLARADASGATARRFYEVVRRPFVVGLLQEARLDAVLRFGQMSDPKPCGDRAIEALRGYEPNVPWEKDVLSYRADCYRRRGVPLAAQAERDWKEYQEHAAQSVRDVLGR